MNWSTEYRPMGGHRFLFETSFDPEEIALREEAARRKAVQPAAPPAPTFTEKQLVEARAKARAEGEQAGLSTAMAGIESRLATLLEGLPGQIQAVMADRQAADAALQAQTVEVALAVAQKLLPELARRHGMVEVEAVIAAALAEMLDEPRLVVRVADSNLDALRGRMEALSAEAGYQGAIILLADPALGPSDCRIEWADGGTARLSSRLWQDIDQTIARSLKPNDPASPWPALLPR